MRVLAISAVLACERFAPDFDAVIALEVAVPDSGIVELGDTLQPRARALNGRGDSVPAIVSWAAIDTAVVEVLDPATGATLGRQVGTGRIQASVGRLRSNPVTLIVQPPLDSARAEGEVRDTVTLSAPDSLSDSLRVRVFATASTAQNLVRRKIALERTTEPAATGVFAFVPDDTVLTNREGAAVFQLRLTGGPRPDRALVTARAERADGTPVPGTPITFVVEFRP